MNHTPQRPEAQAQLARIQQMEALLDETEEAAQQLEYALKRYAAIQPKIATLSDYYQSQLWMHDYDSDKNGQLPSDLKRGILTQDAVFDLLVQQRELEPVLQAWTREEPDCG